MTFKQDWEKTNEQIFLPSTTINAMLKLAVPNKKLTSYAIISGGCANLNIKIIVEEEGAFILRVYLRDKEAAYREHALGALLKQKVPIPQVYFIGDYKTYRFALIEYLPGITLRELLLSTRLHDVGAMMFQVGQMLAKIQAHHFPHGGFFDGHLMVSKTLSEQEYMAAYIDHSLTHPTVLGCLDKEVLNRIKHYFNVLKSLLPNERDRHLVHADFDPANILVNKSKDEWVITGILDWEFAFSSSPLWDVANMLRYSHHMPALFETSFIQGLSTKFTLPKDWHIIIYFLNISSLLDCLTRCTKELQPKQCADINHLIHYFDTQLVQAL